ncbi:cell division protein FtsQ/DivIB [Carboxylicivirga sp. N1Y90]|uniref:cell division protein FtsQ/DivIB n=1 Tax=Carboxylicivirga fragile TaxID=3417571 RepID=UPI003D3357D8|nr:cell division protein FtsQ [Marinilabiliaceae bacterium N1Y90]
MKRLKNIAGIAIIVIYFPIMFSFVSISKEQMVCGVVMSEVKDSVDNQFITRDEIRDIALEKYPGILGRKVNEINSEEVEQFFLKHPAVANCEVYFTYGGAIHVDVTQRQPMLRVFESNKSYYLDRDGEKMPLFKKHSAHVLVASGYLKKLKNKEDLVCIAKTIMDDEFWQAQIEQVYISSKGEFMMVPRVGDHLIEFGSIERMEEKFRNLRALYKNGWESREWNLYKRVNLKYKGQVVCTKA